MLDGNLASDAELFGDLVYPHRISRLLALSSLLVTDSILRRMLGCGGN